MYSAWEKLDAREKAFVIAFYALSLVLTALLAYGWGREAGARTAPIESASMLSTSRVHTIDLNPPLPTPELSSSLPEEAPSTEVREITVHVSGEVHKPGVYTLPEGSRVVDALNKAGDAKPSADTDALNLAEPLADGQKVHFPRKGETAPPSRSTPPPPSATASSPASRGSVQFPLDLNRATAEELEALPGIGPVLAQRIVEYRQQVGRFQSVDELIEVRGIGPKRLEQIRPYVVVR